MQLPFWLENHRSMLTYTGNTGVESDWAPLREVIVGRPSYRIVKPFPRRVRKAVGNETWLMIKREEGKLLTDAFPALQSRAESQMAAAVAALRDHGVVVHEVPPFAEGEEEQTGATAPIGSIQFFPRDSCLVVGNNIFELSLVNPHRRKELAPLRRLLSIRGLDPNQAVQTMTGVAQPEKYRARLEGGDCLVGDAEIFVGISGNASNLFGVSWLRKAIKAVTPSYSVTPIRLSPEFPHLDMALSLLRPGLGIRCLEAFPDGLPASLSKWQWLDVTKNEALKLLATNALPLDSQTSLVVAEAKRVIDGLRALKHKVIPVPFAGVTWLGGGLRCWTLPLLRANTPILP